MKQVFVEEAIKYSEDKNITKENFSFFKDYTNGQFLKRHDVWKTQPLGHDLSSSMNQ
jgi:hypothetical protein